ncbi:peptide deformylase [Wolbachia pipientis]|uniref:Peptide deformylase n=1 Tax=Wolbachia pipientis TaxID=955 RepID=A0A1E7QJU4_WOLPI|nr:peptide deformylase [Wolbachia pipientis]OEY86745.1 peptide deformylase [Wolbachia pipientis]
MSKLPIIIVPDERLVTHSREVTAITDEIKELVDNMFETMYSADGIGLSAVQVGVLERIFIIDIKSDTALSDDNIEDKSGYQATGKSMTIINPEIVELSEEQIVLTEGCLSIPGQAYKIKRPKYLTLKYKDIDNTEQIIKATGWLARGIQHEFDHLNGILYIKYLSKLKYDMAIKKAQKVKRQYE